jgi:hypothetical protein
MSVQPAGRRADSSYLRGRAEVLVQDLCAIWGIRLTKVQFEDAVRRIVSDLKAMERQS